MAKVGEGDPRWIVTNREDGKNVNNWHWTEMDYTTWAKNKLEELLKNLVIENDQISCKTTSVETEGEVTVNTRKKKIILFYELDVKIKWSGTLLDKNVEANGTIQIPYISEENDHDEFEVRVTVENPNREKETLKDHLRDKVIPILKQRVPLMLQELKDSTVGKTKLELKHSPSARLEKLDEKKKEEEKKEKVEKKNEKMNGISVTNFTVQDRFHCSPMDLFQCFVDPPRVKAFAGGDAQASAEVGGKFVLFGGAVTAENVQVIPGQKLVQKWRFSSWPEGHFSTVTLDFQAKDGSTMLKLKQTGVPSDEKEHTEEGWKMNFFARIKGVFGFGGLSGMIQYFL